MRDTQTQNNGGKAAGDGKNPSQPPSISLPRGGGAIKGIGEKFAANPVTGTGSMSVPIAVSPGRSGYGPQLSLSYDSGAGNGPFGFGWSLSLPSISRKTDKGLPKYRDAVESDVFILSGAEDLVPLLVNENTGWKREELPVRTVDGVRFGVRRYRPRIEGLFAKIEQWKNLSDPADIRWRSISKDNITTWYGKTAESRIADPADPTRIFSWLISESYDDKGNAILYEYVGEDSAGVDRSLVQEKNRTDESRSANRYLKRIKYGNLPSRLVQTDLSRMSWLFEVVLDYDEGHYRELEPDGQGRIIVDVAIDPLPGSAWPARQDPFSYYRAGFEVRTYRLCRRILMFHHFKDELGSVNDYLVRSTEFHYSESPIVSFIKSATQSGYVLHDGRFLKKALPPLEFEYTGATIDETVREIDAESLENLPVGLDGAQYQWADLDGEGLSGILSEQAGAWFYKRNVGDGKFGPLELVAQKPSLASLSSGRQQLIDLAGDGQLDLVDFSGQTPGFYERTEDRDWEQFKAFSSLPNIPWNDPNLKFIDLDGDGHADILITEDDAITWHPSLAEEGFGPASRVFAELDEEKGPRVLFADGTESVYLADLSGDGLTDLVRIRNGEVCYWPNLGYGTFGPKVTMDNPPWFDTADQFDQKRIRLADIDGSGTTDILYLNSDAVAIYRNECGNRWSDPEYLTGLPMIDNLSSVIAVDLLGNGTACLVWSSPLPGDGNRPMRYIDLMGGQKPHLLVKSINNLGAETIVHYAASTKFYLADKEAGKPWITRLPFPVHVVERVETFDRISRNRFVTRYAYHHGYFDGEEREFRGFGMVEQWDTEEFATLSCIDSLSPAGGEGASNIDAASHVPPVLTRTWFHTGIYLGRDRVSNFFAGLLNEADTGEYYREPGISDAEAEQLLLADTILPVGLTIDEEREACRALRGSMLRQEVYAIDSTGKEKHPYTVAEQNFTIELLQPRAGNRHAVFFTHPREAVSYQYERNPLDPRVTHSLTLEADDYGNLLKSVSIGYGRRPGLSPLDGDDRRKQEQILITYAENDVTNAIDDPNLYPDDYRSPLPCEARAYEVTGFGLADDAVRFRFEEFAGENNDFQPLLSLTEIEYGQTPDYTEKQKRLIECARTVYCKDDLSGLLGRGLLEPRALPGESYKLAFTPDIVQKIYMDSGKLAAADLDQIFGIDGGYVHSEGDSNWWIPSGRVFFSRSEADDEAAEAANHFYLPRRFKDPFGNSGFVDYDAYDLMPIRTEDAVQNIVNAENDYRVLQPWRMIDPNRNRSAAEFDELGLVIATAVMGKESETDTEKMGDTPDDPTARMEYDLFNWMKNEKPVYVRTLARERHRDPETRWQESYAYSDGFGREIQKKIQAEPGDVGGVYVENRWVGSGWTVFNNKGKPVRQYEPFFSDAPDFEFAKTVGVSPILFYDPAGRQVAALHPNHTWEKVVFDPWQQQTWDVNDTVLKDLASDPDVGDFFRRLPDDDYLPTWHAQRAGGGLGPREQDAADKTAAHADTPATAFLDTLGRPFLTLAHNGLNPDGTPDLYATRVELDIEGNQRSVIDAQGRIVMKYDYYMAGLEQEQNAPTNRIHQASMEAGERWMLNDVAGKPIYAWDNRDHRFRTVYDKLRRPLEVYLREGAGTEIVVGRTVYGEAIPDPEVHNLRGKTYQVFDQAGVVTSEEYDFKGNLLRGSRQLAIEYKSTLNWSTGADLQTEPFWSSTTYDALNRPVTLTTPDNSVIRPSYNEANMLERVEANLRGDAASTVFVSDIDYNAKGQRESIEYGNGARTTYEYDPLTFRLTRLRTMRGAESLQDLSYIYDPAGNITSIRDDAQQTIYFNNTVVEPHADYTYDAIYRLKFANGREHIGQAAKPETTWSDEFRVNLPHPQDGQAMRRYTERYDYDEVGNILRLIHQASDGKNWTRTYTYDELSPIEPIKKNNRLSSTQVGESTEIYPYDAHGNMTCMAHLSQMMWDFKDQLQMVDLGGGGKAWYVYDGAGQRVRKVLEKSPGLTEERIYLGGFEIFRSYDGDGTVTLERETLHIMDDEQRVAMIETRTQGDDGSPAQLIRYQFGNHLGSASLELDAVGKIISYEEYYPYGSTSYQAVCSEIQVPFKRYRYTGMERDEESGLCYHGARYYVPWLSRWASYDPLYAITDVNLYIYAMNHPLGYVDVDGRQPLGPPDLNDMAREFSADLNKVRSIWKNCNVYAEKLAEKLAQWYFGGEIEKVNVYDFKATMIPISIAFPRPTEVILPPSATSDIPLEALSAPEYLRTPRKPAIKIAGRTSSGDIKILSGRGKLVGTVDRFMYFRAGDLVGNPQNLPTGWYLQRGLPYQASSYEFVETSGGDKVRLFNTGGQDAIYTVYTTEGVVRKYMGDKDKDNVKDADEYEYSFSSRHMQTFIVSGAQGEVITAYGNIQQERARNTIGASQVREEHYVKTRGVLYLIPIWNDGQAPLGDRRMVTNIIRYKKRGEP